MKIHEFTIVKISLFFIIGLLIGFYFKIDLTVSTVIQSIAVVLFALSLHFSKKKFSQSRVFGISTFFLFFSIGITINILHDDRIYNNHYTQLNDLHNKHSISIIIREKLKSSLKNNRYQAEIKSIDGKKSNGKIILNIKKDTHKVNLVSGNKLFLQEYISPTIKPCNPNQFDYAAYLEHKNIYAQIYTSQEKTKLSKVIQKDIYHYIFSFREKIITSLKEKGFNREELSVLSALILGQQQDISPETQRDYQFAGAVHILSVSGMHVGFIMIFITFLLNPLPNDNKSNIIRIFITLIALWAFTLIAGLSPSVVRSAAMFSFVAIGSIINRQNNMYHTIFVSLFIILIFEPSFLFDIGFQLSYLALFFIIWFQPILKKTWTPKNKIVTYFWDILTVSIAAQVGTLPLSIYYFHQFPGLFFATNLVLVPMVFIIMILGSILMILTLFDFVPMFLLKSVERLLFLMNVFIQKIASVESLIIKNISLTFTLLIISYVLIYSIILLWKNFNYKRLVLFLTSCIVFQIFLIKINWDSKNDNNFIVFNTKNKSILGIKKGKNLEVNTDSTLIEGSFDRNTIQSFTTANYCNISKESNIKNCYYFEGKKILVIDNEKVITANILANIIIIRNSPKINLDRFLQKSKPEIVIADASNYISYVNLWEATCKNKKIPFHSTYEKGFYKL